MMPRAPSRLIAVLSVLMAVLASGTEATSAAEAAKPLDSSANAVLAWWRRYAQ